MDAANMKDIVMAHSGSLHFKQRQGKNQKEGHMRLDKKTPKLYRNVSCGPMWSNDTDPFACG